MSQSLSLLSKKELEERVLLLQRKLDRERNSRVEAENLLETKSKEIYLKNQELRHMNINLERMAGQRSTLFTSLIMSMNQGILVEDEHRKILLTNDTFRELFNIPVSNDDLKGGDCAMAAKMASSLFVSPAEFIESNNEKVMSDDPHLGEVFHLADGRIFERDSIPVFHEEVKFGHLWIYRDVTTDYNIRRRIEESEEKYRGIIENMELGLLEVDLNHTITKAYDWFCDMTGYEAAELLGKNAMELLLPEEYHYIMQGQDDKRLEKKQSVYEVELIKKNGERIWVLISGAPFYDQNGNVVGSIGIHYEITERKKLEEDLKEARLQAEHLRDVEKEFLAKMSHEIRNPINAIIGLTSLLYDTNPTHDQLQYLNNIKYSADILLGLISGVLDVAKLEAGQLELIEKEMCLEDTLKALVKIVDFKKENKEIDFKLSLDKLNKSKIVADPVVINQIFLNLLSNAVKFTEEGSIEVDVAQIEETEEKVHLECKVVDTGIGISKDDVGKIFDSFKQANNETKLKYGGTGLGLAIVKQLVEKYDGSITVESKEGMGSTFTFDLWVKKQIISSSQEISTNQFSKSGDHRLLIVEDNKVNQLYLKGLLTKWQINYDIAGDGMQALSLLSKEKYDLILMDIRMPVMDGYETTIRLRAMKETDNANAPIIALTASAMVDEKERALSAGMNYHITKPFTPDQLALILEKFNILTRGNSGENKIEIGFLEELDATYLETFYGNDYDRAALLFNIFLETIDNDVNMMVQHYDNENWNEFREIAHKIKPNFRMVGLSDLSDKILKYEETVAKNLDLVNITKDFSETIEIFEKKKHIVKKQLELLTKNKANA